jgi:acyl-CoA thioesterase
MADRAERAAELLADDPYAQSLGVRLVEVTDNAVTVAMVVAEGHHNFGGSTHGGVLFSLADVALSLAGNVPGPAVAIDTHLAITAASAAGDELVATAIEVTRGRTLSTYRVEVRRASDGRICGTFTGTNYILPAEEAVE